MAPIVHPTHPNLFDRLCSFIPTLEQRKIFCWTSNNQLPLCRNNVLREYLKLQFAHVVVSRAVNETFWLDTAQALRHVGITTSTIGDEAARHRTNLACTLYSTKYKSCYLLHISSCKCSLLLILFHASVFLKFAAYGAFASGGATLRAKYVRARRLP